MVVLWIFAHATVQRNTASRFGLCQATVSRIIEELLPMFVILYTEFVRLLEDNWLDLGIELNERLNAFNGYIGAVDGTYIPAFVPLQKQRRWFDRYGEVS